MKKHLIFTKFYFIKKQSKIYLGNEYLVLFWFRGLANTKLFIMAKAEKRESDTIMLKWRLMLSGMASIPDWVTWNHPDTIFIHRTKPVVPRAAGTGFHGFIK